jgi:hypothetical protein
VVQTFKRGLASGRVGAVIWEHRPGTYSSLVLILHVLLLFSLSWKEKCSEALPHNK